jgi:hypothetical protein
VKLGVAEVKASAPESLRVFPVARAFERAVAFDLVAEAFGLAEDFFAFAFFVFFAGAFFARFFAAISFLQAGRL